MEGQYFILICDDKDSAIEKAIETLKRHRGGQAYSESRGTGIQYRNDYGGGMNRNMSHREREIYEMGMRAGFTPEEHRLFEMGKRDAYGRNGAENMREDDRMTL